SQTPPVPIYDRGGLTVTSAPLNPSGSIPLGQIQFFLRVELTASSVEGVNVTSITFHLNGDAAPSGVRIDLWWDKDKDNQTDGSDGDYGDATFSSSSDLTFTLSPAVSVAAGATEHLIAKVSVYAPVDGGDTVGIQISSSSSLAATGALSGLGIVPAGSFPRASYTVPVAN
ncbi:MAG TPA: hypothetical protein VGB42_10745, partial [Candidatus Thermoplasmatota archaeon]